MRLSPRDVASDLFSFLLFVRLGFVTFMCFPGVLIVSKQYGPGIGAAACVIAFPLWWYHFGLPRFKEQRSGFFSARFCLFGYIAVSASLAATVLEYFGIIQEGRPVPFVDQVSPYLRIAVIIGFVVFCFYEFAKRKRRDDG